MRFLRDLIKEQKYFKTKSLAAIITAAIGNSFLQDYAHENAMRTSTLEQGDSAFSLRYYWNDSVFVLEGTKLPENTEGIAYFFGSGEEFYARTFNKDPSITSRSPYYNVQDVPLSRAREDYDQARAMACTIAQNMASVEQGWIRGPIEDIKAVGYYFISDHCL